MNKVNKRLSVLLREAGLSEGCLLMVHSSFNGLKAQFGENDPAYYITDFESVTGKSGALIMPAFTYCFMKSGTDNSVIYNPESTPSLTGYLTEYFRRSPGVKRTHSPTHSFCVSGDKIQEEILRNYSKSPLGKGSFMSHFAQTEDSYVLLACCSLQSLTLLHYIENIAEDSYTDINPWEHLGILPLVNCFDGIHETEELPGCSKGFSRAADFINKNRDTQSFREISENIYLIRVKYFIPLILNHLNKDKYGLLCPPGTCQACDSRRKYHD